MPSFVKLPSGRGVNTDNISAWNNPIKSSLVPGDKLDDAMLILFTNEEDGAVWFRGADARALYAYLSAQAVAIGEDGKPVDAGVKVNTNQVKLSFELTEPQWSALEFLGQDMDRALSFADLERKARISLSELEKLEIERLIVRNRYAYPNTFELSASGFDFLVNEVTK